MVWIMAKVALVAERRTWAGRPHHRPQRRWLFLVLIGAGSPDGVHGQPGPSGLTIGGIALVMLFVGFFLFMGFIWAVIGE